MSYLVSELLINPVLRQARRFSRTHEAADVDELTNRSVVGIAQDDPANAEVERVPGDGEGMEDVVSGSLSGAPMVSSPIEDDGGLDAELEALSEQSRSTSGVTESASGMPLRVASLRSGEQAADDYTSGNPSYGMPGRFHAGSPMSASYSSIMTNGPEGRGSPAGGSSRRSTQDALASTAGSRHRNNSLPEDDGMGALRRRIVSIQEMECSAAEKAQLMHRLLTEGYNHTQYMLHAKQIPRPPSPSSMVSQEIPGTPASLNSFTFWQTTGTPASSPPNPSNIFHLSPGDLQPTFTPLKVRDPGDDNGNGDSEDAAEPAPALGCSHYKRNVKLQCSACSRWYTCRFCHDEVEDHLLNRKETKNMLCMLCGSAQRAGEVCVECGARAAWYYCSLCKLWDDDPGKSIYHCNDCGICRVGRGLGKDFIHCKASRTPHRNENSTNALSDMRRVYVHLDREVSSMHRALHRLRLPHLRRVHVYLASNRRFHELRSQHTPQMLLQPFEIFI